MIKDHLGHTFRTEEALYMFWGLKAWTYYERKLAGWSLEKILTTPLNIRPDTENEPIKKPIQHKQHRLISTVRRRIKGGMLTIKEYQRG